VDDWAGVGVQGVFSAPGAVDVLVGDDEGAGGEFGFEGADRAGGEDLAYAEVAERPEVRAVVHLVRGEPVVRAVPGDERDLAAVDLADQGWFARPPERGVDLDRPRAGQERVEAGSTDHTDFCHAPTLGAATAAITRFAYTVSSP
jgi:antitoxin (DNA-binding transcriptional repressor) of toxin-antitoxin stability system